MCDWLSRVHTMSRFTQNLRIATRPLGGLCGTQGHFVCIQPARRVQGRTLQEEELMALLAEIVTSTKFVVGELWAFDPESDKDVRGGNRDRSLHDSSQRRPSRPPADHSWHAGPLASPGAAKTLPRNHSHQLLHAAVQNNVLRGSPSPARGPPSPFAAIRPGAAALEDGAFEEARAGLQERHASPDTSGHSARGARRSSIGMSAGGTVSPDSSGRGRLGSLGAALVRTGTGMRSALRSSTGMSSASRHSAPDSRALRFTGLRYVRPSFAGPTAGKPLVHGQLPLEDEVARPARRVRWGRCACVPCDVRSAWARRESPVRTPL